MRLAFAGWQQVMETMKQGLLADGLAVPCGGVKRGVREDGAPRDATIIQW